MKIIVIGASGHVGRAAVAALASRHEVVEAGRSSDPAVDITDPASIQAFFETVGEVDAVVSAAGAVPFAPLAELRREDYLAGIEGKVLSQVGLVRIATPFLRDGGSITLTSGIVGRAQIATGAAAALANGALEAFVRAAATELPRGLRLNAVSPTVLAEAEGYHDAFPGFVPVASEIVGAAFRRSVEGVETGQVYALD